MNYRHALPIAAFAIAITAIFQILFTQTPTAVHAQADPLLSRRIDQVEQRFYFLESRLNRIESESRTSGLSPVGGQLNAAEVSLMRNQIDQLRTQVDDLRLRMTEVECGVIKLDERTLTPPYRAAQRQLEQELGKRDPCRANPNAAIRVSSRN